ncbi:hypothetical protein [Klebsiella phage vB_KpnM-VAC25]|uniref:Uncharacterized protein n=1 Tax=Klebsiella phage vB_KpnM-VAC25 TaxID=2866703 RepID=A0A976M163_9CAUD|nr:hypothetical protein [Klebsiella phage vB_KpnM-VAC25]
MSLCLRSRLTYLHSLRITPCPFTSYGHSVLLYAVLDSIG